MNEDSQTRTIRLENVGPIDRLSIPLPDAGVVVLRGRNGAGKSHALAAVDSLIGGRGRPPCRDGARKGLVEGVGAKITIGRSTRRTGEAEVVTLEGRLDISQLVQPPIKDEEAADRQRIKALIQLSGQPADAQTFKTILPDDIELGELLAPGDLAGDPVSVASKIKRALEAEARRFERTAADALSRANTLEGQIGDAALDVLDEQDAVEQRRGAEAELEKALLALRELETRAEQVEQRRQQAEKAKQTLDSLRSQVPADQSIESLEVEEAELAGKIEKLERALAVARERRQQLRRQLDQARRVQAQIEQLEQVVAKVPEPVPGEQIEQARQAVAEARKEYDRAVEAVRIYRIQQQALEARQQLRAAEISAERLRRAARATDDVLNDLVGRVTGRLRVEAGRLVCDTDRGVEPFSELSPGERWRIALEIAVEQVGQGGLVTVPQECWEGLDPINRAEIAEIARQVGVVILTAEADQCEEIRAEIAGDASGGHRAAEEAATQAVKEGPR